jgi:hypothetical protein
MVRGYVSNFLCDFEAFRYVFIFSLSDRLYACSSYIFNEFYSSFVKATPLNPLVITISVQISYSGDGTTPVGANDSVFKLQRRFYC